MVGRSKPNHGSARSGHGLHDGPSARRRLLSGFVSGLHDDPEAFKPRRRLVSGCAMILGVLHGRFVRRQLELEEGCQKRLWKDRPRCEANPEKVTLATLRTAMA